MADSASPPPAPATSLLKRTQWLQRALTPWTKPVVQRLALTVGSMSAPMPLAARDALAISGRVQRLGGGEAPTPSLGPAQPTALPLYARTVAAPTVAAQAAEPAPTPEPEAAPAVQRTRDIFSMLSKLPPLKKESSYDRPTTPPPSAPSNTVARSPLPTGDATSTPAIQMRRGRRFSQIEEITPASAPVEKAPASSTSTFDGPTSFEDESSMEAESASEPEPDFGPLAQAQTAAPSNTLALKREASDAETLDEPGTGPAAFSGFFAAPAARALATVSTETGSAPSAIAPTVQRTPASPVAPTASSPTLPPTAKTSVPVGEPASPVATVPTPFDVNQKSSSTEIIDFAAETKPTAAAPFAPAASNIQRAAQPDQYQSPAPTSPVAETEIAAFSSTLPTSSAETTPAVPAAPAATTIQRTPATPPAQSTPNPASVAEGTAPSLPTAAEIESVWPTLSPTDPQIQRRPEATVSTPPAPVVSPEPAAARPAANVQRTLETSVAVPAQPTKIASTPSEAFSVLPPTQTLASAPTSPTTVQRTPEPKSPSVPTSPVAEPSVTTPNVAAPTTALTKNEAPPASPIVQRTPEATSARTQPAAAKTDLPTSTANSTGEITSTSIPPSAEIGSALPAVTATPNLQRTPVVPTTNSTPTSTGDTVSGSEISPLASAEAFAAEAQTFAQPTVQRTSLPLVTTPSLAPMALTAETPKATPTQGEIDEGPISSVVQRTPLPLATPTVPNIAATGPDAIPQAQQATSVETSVPSGVSVQPTKPAIQRASEPVAQATSISAQTAFLPVEPSPSVPTAPQMHGGDSPSVTPVLLQRQPTDEAAPELPGSRLSQTETPALPTTPVENALGGAVTAPTSPAVVQRKSAAEPRAPSGPSVSATPAASPVVIQRSPAEPTAAPVTTPTSAAATVEPASASVEIEGDWSGRATTDFGVLDSTPTPLAIQRTPMPLVAPESAPETPNVAAAPATGTPPGTPKSVETPAKATLQRKATAPTPDLTPEAPDAATSVAPATLSQPAPATSSTSGPAATLQRHVDAPTMDEVEFGEVATPSVPSGVSPSAAAPSIQTKRTREPLAANAVSATPSVPSAQPNTTLQRAVAEVPPVVETSTAAPISASVEPVASAQVPSTPDLPLAQVALSTATAPAQPVQRTPLATTPPATSTASATPTFYAEPTAEPLSFTPAGEAASLVQAKPQPEAPTPLAASIQSSITTAEAPAVATPTQPTPATPTVQRASISSQPAATLPAMPLMQATPQPQPSASLPVQRSPELQMADTPSAETPVIAQIEGGEILPAKPLPPTTTPARVQRTPTAASSATLPGSIAPLPVSAMGQTLSADAPSAAPTVSPTQPAIQRQPLPLVSTAAAPPARPAPAPMQPAADDISIKPLSEIVQARATASRLAQSFPPLVQRWVNRAPATPEIATSPLTIAQPEARREAVAPASPLPSGTRDLPLAVSTGVTVQRAPSTPSNPGSTARAAPGPTTASPTISTAPAPAGDAVASVPAVSAPPPEPMRAPTFTGTSVVQRDGETDATTPATTVTTAPTNTTTTATPKDTQADLDKLAREVYPYIRRLLAIERERRSL